MSDTESGVGRGYIAGAHICRSWSPPDPFVADCGCGQAPCGAVDGDKIDPDCPQHSLRSYKTIRSRHAAVDCPAVDPGLREALERAEKKAGKETEHGTD